MSDLRAFKTLSEQHWAELTDALGLMGYKVEQMTHEEMYQLALEIITLSSDRGKLVNSMSPRYAKNLERILKHE